MHTRVIFYTQTERRGNRQTVRETEKERVQVWECCGKTDLGVYHKNPLTSFWDKLERITIFWETIFYGEVG
jgi:hypothetical protein